MRKIFKFIIPFSLLITMIISCCGLILTEGWTSSLFSTEYITNPSNNSTPAASMRTKDEPNFN